MSKRTVVLGLGSNIDPLAHLRCALAEIKKISGVVVLDVASIYESDALLPENAPDNWNQKYLNSAVKITIENFEPLQLLQDLKNIEIKIGREFLDRWAPRKIDIDILWAEDFTFTHEKLNIPHTQILKRPFVLLPLLQLVPDFKYEKPQWLNAFNTHVSANKVWPKLVGILNLSIDSFSGDGDFNLEQKLTKHLYAGAEIIDLGAESTRPGSEAVDAGLEHERLNSALKFMEKYKADHNCEFEISIDCRKFEVLEKIIKEHKIDYINDVEGFRDPRMLGLLKNNQIKAICMHSFSVPPIKTETILTDVNPWDFLTQWWIDKKQIFTNAGIESNRIIFDLGIGFGKTAQQSLDLLGHLEIFNNIHEEIFVGHSRKSFLSLLTDKPAAERDLETAQITKKINQAYCQYLRVHNVGLNLEALL